MIRMRKKREGVEVGAEGSMLQTEKCRSLEGMGTDKVGRLRFVCSQMVTGPIPQWVL